MSNTPNANPAATEQDETPDVVVIEGGAAIVITEEEEAQRDAVDEPDAATNTFFANELVSLVDNSEIAGFVAAHFDNPSKEEEARRMWKLAEDLAALDIKNRHGNPLLPDATAALHMMAGLSETDLNQLESLVMTRHDIVVDNVQMTMSGVGSRLGQEDQERMDQAANTLVGVAFKLVFESSMMAEITRALNIIVKNVKDVLNDAGIDTRGIPELLGQPSEGLSLSQVVESLKRLRTANTILRTNEKSAVGASEALKQRFDSMKIAHDQVKDSYDTLRRNYTQIEKELRDAKLKEAEPIASSPFLIVVQVVDTEPVITDRDIHKRAKELGVNLPPSHGNDRLMTRFLGLRKGMDLKGKIESIDWIPVIDFAKAYKFPDAESAVKAMQLIQKFPKKVKKHHKYDSKAAQIVSLSMRKA